MSATYVTAGHLDDFALLRFVAADLSEFENGAARRHLRTCDSCRSALQEIEVLDAGLRQVTDQLRKEHASREMAFPGGDPFRRRPRPRPAGASGAAGRDPALIDVCRDAAQDATPRRDALLAAALESDHALRDSLHALRLTELTDRYALGYGLDAALGRMVEAPARWLALGDAATARVRRERRLDSDPRVERAVPLAHLGGAARLLSGAACNWTGDLERGGRELAAAWRAFTAGDLSSMRLAQVDVVESRRRTFLERADEGIAIADRAQETFAALDLTEKMARARGAQAL